MMLMAAHGVVYDHMQVGQFVLVNTYLIQLYVPLNFLGFVYFQLNQGLVDMEQMFALMRVNYEITDQPLSLIHIFAAQALQGRREGSGARL